LWKVGCVLGDDAKLASHVMAIINELVCVFGMGIDNECNYTSCVRNCMEVYENKMARLRTFDVTSNICKVHATRSLWQQEFGQNSNNNNRYVGQETYSA
jgi:hypothetical protein